MKKKLCIVLISIISVLCLVFSFTACASMKFKVSFVVDGQTVYTIDTNGDEVIAMPPNPQKDDYIFDGWYWDKDIWENPFTENSLLGVPLSSNTNVYCKWRPEHKHAFIEEVIEDKYKSSNANCIEKAKYYYSCECGEKGVETFEHGNLGEHMFMTYKYNNDATCVADGTETAKCYNCSETDTRISKGHLKTGKHTFTTYTYNNDATCGVDGTETAKCKNCDEHNTRVSAEHLKTRKHIFTTYTYNNDATCGVDGTETAKCENCDEHNTRVSAAHLKTGEHTFTTYTYNNDATCGVDGTETAKCENCRERDTRKSETHLKTEKHIFLDYICKICNKLDDDAPITDDLIYSEIFDKDKNVIGYAVTGNKTDSKYIKIPTTYKNKPVKRIGYGAFVWRYNLLCVSIPDSVTDFGDWPFSSEKKYEVRYEGDIASWVKISGLKSLNYGKLYINNVEIVGELIIPDSITDIGEYAFYGCRGLTSVTIPNSVTSIGDGTFSSCTNLTSITIPDSVTSIGKEAFYYCSSLTSITIPAGVTSIGDYAFYRCSSLTSITIPDSVTSIGESAFSECGELKYRECDNALYLGNINNPYLILMAAKNTAINTCIINNNTRIIYDSAFKNCNNLTSIEIPRCVTNIGKGAFSGCNRLTSMILPFVGGSVTETIASEKTLFGYIFGASKYSDSILIEQVYYNEKYQLSASSYIPASLTNVTVLGGEMLYGAFWGCSNLATVTVGESVTSIGNLAFYNCKNLTSITICEGVKNIDGGAFNSCSGLTSVTIPDSVTSIGGHAFYDCRSLTNVTIGNSVRSIGSSAFSGCRKITSIAIPNGVTSIPGSALSGFSLTRIELPGSVRSIGEYAFSFDDRIVDIYYYGDIKSWCEKVIDDWAFCGYNNSNHGKYNLYIDNELITDIIIPSEVTIIRSYAFQDCVSLKSVVKEGNCAIDSSAFEGCSSLTSIDISGDIYYSAFRNCSSLTSVKLGDVAWIYRGAFSGCNSLKSINISNSVEHIRAGAFSGCEDLTIYCEAKSKPQSWESEWNEKDSNIVNNTIVYTYYPVVWGYRFD